MLKSEQWKSDWNIIGYTQRRRNYLDLKGIKDNERFFIFIYFLNKRAEKAKPYVRHLTNLRLKVHIFTKIY